MLDLWKIRALRSLRHRNSRLLLEGALISSTGDFIHIELNLSRVTGKLKAGCKTRWRQRWEALTNLLGCAAVSLDGDVERTVSRGWFILTKRSMPMAQNGAGDDLQLSVDELRQRSVRFHITKL